MLQSHSSSFLLVLFNFSLIVNNWSGYLVKLRNGTTFKYYSYFMKDILCEATAHWARPDTRSPTAITIWGSDSQDKHKKTNVKRQSSEPHPAPPHPAHWPSEPIANQPTACVSRPPWVHDVWFIQCRSYEKKWLNSSGWRPGSIRRRFPGSRRYEMCSVSRMLNMTLCWLEYLKYKSLQAPKVCSFLQ